MTLYLSILSIMVLLCCIVVVLYAAYRVLKLKGKDSNGKPFTPIYYKVAMCIVTLMSVSFSIHTALKIINRIFNP